MTHHHPYHPTPTNELLSDKTFLTQFQNQTLSPVHFNHIGHLRLAWLYLTHHDVETAVQRVSAGIKAYAESLGATTKFHTTITDSIVRIMAKRVEQMEQKEWQLFLEHNKDLVDNSVSVLLQFYSKDLLFSETARTSLMQPDIKPI